jgi:hypothetical protein
MSRAFVSQLRFVDYQVDMLSCCMQQRSSKPTIPAVAYLTPDQQRDERAASLVYLRQISAPSLLPDDGGLTFQCYSSEALEDDPAPVQYTITILFNGAATCKCQDFQKHGGASPKVGDLADRR